MKKSGIVILYNPEIELVKKNIFSYVNFLDQLIIIDNSDVSHKNYFLDLDCNIRYISNLKNEGISKVLNMAAKQSIADGYELMLTMDQDSFFSEDMIKKYVDFADSLDWKKISMIGVNPIDYDSTSIIKSKNNLFLIPSKLLITSGSFLNLNLFNQIGGFDERLFIDWVDYDYCLRSIIRNYLIYIVSDVFLFHIGGVPRKIMGRNIALYSSERYYYIFRNHISMWFRYIKHFPKLIIKNIIFTLTFSLLPNIIFSNNKKSFLTSLFKAIKDVPKVLR